jgi:hypothetical protein
MPLRRSLFALLMLAASLASIGSVGAQNLTIDRPAELRLGTCAELGDLVHTLSHLMLSSGDLLGQENATPVEQSFTIVPFTVRQLVETNHVVTVQASPESDEIVACGEIGGVMNPDGTLAAGMRGMNGSGLSGVAYFTPNPGYESSLVTILLVSENPPAVDTPESDATGTS